jgi:hypothetical protein
MQLHTFLTTLMLALFLSCAAGCGGNKDEAAAQKCIESGKTSGVLCQECCKKAKAPGHYWQKGDGCKCL